MTHEFEHPSLLFELRSSHASDPHQRPSPHIDVHVEADDEDPPEQVNPRAKLLQRALQPTKLLESPSSQTSFPTFLPSPQIGEQVDGLNKSQVNPTSIVQVEEQPSPSTSDPSSHYSEEVFDPSPQF